MNPQEEQRINAVLPLVPVSVHIEMGRISDDSSALIQTSSKTPTTVVRLAPASTLATYAVPLLNG